MKAVIYTKTTCPYCSKAKDLLKSRNISYDEKIIDGVNLTKEDMQAEIGVSGLNTVPQIVLDGKFIAGGYTGLRVHFEQEG